MDIISAETEREVVDTLFQQREHNRLHLAYETERAFYEAVKDGDIDKIRACMLPLEDIHLGLLSHNKLQNLKYHLVVMIAMITRYCIEGGMLPEKAYTLSDVYIQKTDACTECAEIDALHEKIIFDYAEKMSVLKKQPQYSEPVLKVMEFITNHLHDKITLDDAAAEAGLNKTYLCELFRKENGGTILQYANTQKIEAAENMLIYTHFSPADVGDYLAYASYSHFITAFKKETGLTPGEYKKKFARTFFPAR